MITEDYVSFEIAKLLKEKGFDERCDHYIDCHWEEDGVVLHTPCKTSDLMFGFMCPTHQMAMKWLREKHVYICPVPAYFHTDYSCSWDCDIWADDNYEKAIRDKETYEETVEAALKYSLENLI